MTLPFCCLFFCSPNMLPTLGLFKSLPCPLFPNCNRDPCVFSHERTRIGNKKIFSEYVPNRATCIDPPLQTIKRPKPETSSSSVTDTTATLKKQKTATPSSLVSARSASSSSKGSHRIFLYRTVDLFFLIEIPSPVASIVNKTKSVISKPTTTTTTTTQIPKKPTQTVRETNFFFFF